MNTLAIDTLPELSLPELSASELTGPGSSLSKLTLLESTVRMRERADCPVAMGELLAGKYQLERVVGIGGMGVVVLAWHAELQQRVALKLLRESFAGHAEARERFRREARAAARISSDHVVRVFDVATLENGVPYMVMEHLEGQNLRELLRKVGPLEEHEVAAIVIQVCEALAEAHANQIIHRDLKPENVYLTFRPNRPPLVKVLDFGVSKSLAANTVPHMKLTPASMLRGSPAYMSPEQLDCKRDFDARSDVWGAGVLIFELLTQHLPFRGETLPQVICAVLAGQRVPLAQHRQGVSSAMEAILARCLTPEPDDRFRTVQGLAHALRPLAALHDDWAARFAQHLVPNAAEAGAYGKAHIVGEAVRLGTAVIPPPAPKPMPNPTLSSAPTFSAAPADWPQPPLFRLPPRAHKRTLGLALAAGGAGACAAALVVLSLIWMSREPEPAPASHVPSAATERSQKRAVRSSLPRTLPARSAPAAPPDRAPESSAASLPPLAARARVVHELTPAESMAHAEDRALALGRAPARDVPARAVPPARAPSAVPGTAEAPAGSSYDPHAISDFGGRR